MPNFHDHAAADHGPARRQSPDRHSAKSGSGTAPMVSVVEVNHEPEPRQPDRPAPKAEDDDNDDDPEEAALAKEPPADGTDSDAVAGNDDTWTLAQPPLAQANPPRLTLQVKIVDWVYVNVVIDSPTGGRDTSSLEQVLLVKGLPGVSDEAEKAEFLEAISQVLDTCRRTYGTLAPTFGTNLRFRAKSSAAAAASCEGGDEPRRHEHEHEHEVVEETCPDLLRALDVAEETLGPLTEGMPRIPRTELRTATALGLFLLPNTRLVEHDGRRYVAKGPIYASRVADDLLDVKNLLQLWSSAPSSPLSSPLSSSPDGRSRAQQARDHAARGHPNVMAPPEALVSVSAADPRICGFLTPLFVNGNADVHARRMRARGLLTARTLTRWFRQVASAVRWLAGRGTWHGDLKPDNLLVDGRGDVVLIDFTRVFATLATASPEVREHCARHSPWSGYETAAAEGCGCSGMMGPAGPTNGKSGTKAADETRDPTATDGPDVEALGVNGTPGATATICGGATGVPLSWALDRIVRSEVYSVGRTMHLLCEGTSMVELYARCGWMNFAHEFPTEFGAGSATPPPLRGLILRCVESEPERRIGLDELIERLERLEMGVDGQG